MNVPIHCDEPVPGFYKTRLCRGGPWVAVCIADDPQFALADGQTVKMERVWPWAASNPISREEYLYLLALGEWAKANAPDHPAAKPHEPINLLTAKTPF